MTLELGTKITGLKLQKADLPEMTQKASSDPQFIAESVTDGLRHARILQMVHLNWIDFAKPLNPM